MCTTHILKAHIVRRRGIILSSNSTPEKSQQNCKNSSPFGIFRYEPTSSFKFTCMVGKINVPRLGFIPGKEAIHAHKKVYLFTDQRPEVKSSVVLEA